METAAEIHDFINEDLSKIYPDLAKFSSITVYDVAPKVLGAFDDKLVEHATKHFGREGIEIKTSRNIESLTAGLPGLDPTGKAKRPGATLKLKDEGEIGTGLCIWSTGLMMNPFVAHALSEIRNFPAEEVIYKAQIQDAEAARWTIHRDEKSGSIITNDRLRVILNAEGSHGGKIEAAYMRDVFAIGDCAIVQNTAYPATAQVANQKGEWLAKRLNKGELHGENPASRFKYRNLGVMAYLGNCK